MVHNFIRWRVDERLVHERVEWDPTPVPHLPMQFNINLWHSRSRELAARLDRAKLPAQSAIRRIELSPGIVPPGGVGEARVYEDSHPRNSCSGR